MWVEWTGLIISSVPHVSRDVLELLQPEQFKDIPMDQPAG